MMYNIWGTTKRVFTYSSYLKYRDYIYKKMFKAWIRAINLDKPIYAEIEYDDRKWLLFADPRYVGDFIRTVGAIPEDYRDTVQSVDYDIMKEYLARNGFEKVSEV